MRVVGFPPLAQRCDADYRRNGSSRRANPYSAANCSLDARLRDVGQPHHLDQRPLPLLRTGGGFGARLRLGSLGVEAAVIEPGGVPLGGKGGIGGDRPGLAPPRQ